MKKTLAIAILSAASLCMASCTKENKSKDRSEAKDMYEQICKLTKDYTKKLADSPDSVSWAAACTEFEEKLDKINFSYPPDTDLLLTEGQNDTIHSLMQQYIEARDKRIQSILHPIVEVDSISDSDSIGVAETVSGVNQADASHSHGN